MKLYKEFFNRSSVEVAKDLLGKSLFVKFEKSILSGVINETEAYRGLDDDACHARKGKTKRCEVMFGPAGYAYVYFTYGMYYMLNFVCEKEDFPSAVLIRSVIPTRGEDSMAKNSYGQKLEELSKYNLKNLTNGPGKLTKAFGITKENHNGVDLEGPEIWLGDKNTNYKDEQIKITPRIGIDYAKKSKNWPWRFYISEEILDQK